MLLKMSDKVNQQCNDSNDEQHVFSEHEEDIEDEDDDGNGNSDDDDQRDEDEDGLIDNNVQNEEIIDNDINDDVIDEDVDEEEDDEDIDDEDIDDDMDDQQHNNSMINDEADDEAVEEEDEEDIEDDDNSNRDHMTITSHHNNAIDVNNDNNVDNNAESIDQSLMTTTENDGVYQWSAFTGLRVKTFSVLELQAFRKPFELGWKREVVLRGTVTSSGKKIGDVYYFSSDKKTKLRSYVEMGLFLKRNPTSGLVPENFTFARQPIFRPPAEIVRHAMQRGGGQHAITPTHIIDSSPFTPIAPPLTSSHASTPNVKTERSARNSTASESEEQFSMSIAEGRAKRKRVAPSRFEDEDYSESSPFKKKTKADKIGGMSGGLGGIGGVGGCGPSQMSSLVKSSSQIRQQNSSQNSSNSSKTQLSIQEKRRQLQHQLLQQVHEQNLRKQQQLNQQNGTRDTSTHAQQNDNSEHVNDGNDKSMFSQTNARKSIQTGIQVKMESNSNTNEEINVNNGSNNDTNANAVPNTQSQQQQQQSGVPCSMSCVGRRGMLPNLMCSRCFCLYHLDCVPGGVFLREPRVFVCPNCLKPEDTQQEEDIPSMVTTNGHHETQERDVTEALKSFAGFVTSSLVTTTQQQQHVMKARHVSTFAPILPKPPQASSMTSSTQQQQQQSQQTHASFKPNRKPSVVPHSSVPQSVPNQCSLPVARVETGNTGLPKEAMNVKLPAGTHLYRVVSSGPNGHSMIVKNKPFNSNQQSFKPIIQMNRNARKTSSAMTSSGSHHVSHQRQQQNRNMNTNNNFVSRVNRAQQNLYSFPGIAPIAPIGPIKMTTKQLQQFLEPSMFSNRTAMRAHVTHAHNTCSLHSSLLTPYLCLNKVLSYLHALDLVRLKRVCRAWHSLASQPFLWRHISLKGVLINDWLYLARNIIETNATVELDFDGIRTQGLNGGTCDELCDTWRNFATIVDYLRSVRTLKFGSIPTFVLEEVTNASQTDNCYNNFANLEMISVRNLFEEESQMSSSKPCSLSFLEQFHCLPQLRCLQLNSKNGFIGTDDNQTLMTRVFTKLNCLETLVLTSLKDFSSEQFVFLESLKSLKHLEIGSCKQWFSCHDNNNTDNNGFKYLSKLIQLKTLRMIDVIINESNTHLIGCLKSLESLSSLTFDSIQMDDTCSRDDITTIWHAFTQTLKSMKTLNCFGLSSSDPLTNRYVLDLLKKLDNCQKILWKVDTVVEDSGECFIPFNKCDEELDETDDQMMSSDDVITTTTGNDDNGSQSQSDSLKYMDLTFLNELIQSELGNTFIEIKPN